MTDKMTVHVDIVSAEAQIFSGLAERIIAEGALGELGIYPRHTPLLTALKPGPIRVTISDQVEEIFYVSGGVLEVQPHMVTVLADTVVRAADLDEAAALETKERTEKIVAEHRDDIDYAKATADLAQALAQLQAIQKLKKRIKGER